MATSKLLIFMVVGLFTGATDTLELLPRPHVVEDGDPVLGLNSSLRCVVLILPSDVSFDQLNFTWFKDSQELEDQSQDRLHFVPVGRSDAGAYTCRISDGNPLTTSPESKPHHLYVLVRPKVSIEPKNTTSEARVILGNNLTLTCVVKDDIPRVLDDGYTWSYLPYGKTEWSVLPEKGRSLELGHVTLEVIGDYRCQARNDKGLQEPIPPGEDTVSVQAVYLENITLTPELEVTEGDHVALTCNVDSYPDAKLTWMVDGREVRHVTYNVDHYVLENAACSDNKTYTCRASNTDLPGLERHASTRLTVHCSEEVARNDSAVPAHPSEGCDVTLAATLRCKLPDVTKLPIFHPSGSRMMTWQPPCRLDVTPEFRSRVTDVACDATAGLLTFTLSNVTGEDHGQFRCGEERLGLGTAGCGVWLLVRDCDGGRCLSLAWLGVFPCFIAGVLTALVIDRLLQRRHRQKTIKHQETGERSMMVEPDHVPVPVQESAPL